VVGGVGDLLPHNWRYVGITTEDDKVFAAPLLSCVAVVGVSFSPTPSFHF
jgi:hypothetical protein